jgi:dipeptidyl aminopeptidase/acylaminoacyl peptidase
VLPAVAFPLGIISFFGTKAATLREVSMFTGSDVTMPSRLSPIIWDTGFAVWLLLAALYIPTHLYAREKDLSTFEFLRTMPLDRFRLWWYRLLIGITAMTGTGLTLWAIIMILKLFHQTSPDFMFHGKYIVVVSTCIAAILFSLSSFFSALFRRQLSAIAGVVFVFLLLGAIFWIGRTLDQGTSLLDSFPTYRTPSFFILLGKFSFTRNLDYLSILLLILCPSCLFLSLAVFARGNMARQSRRRTTLAYTLLAIVALSPVSLGFSRLLAGVETLDWISSDTFLLQSVSPDGTRILLESTHKEILEEEKHYARPKTKWNGESIVLIDLPKDQISTIEENRIFSDLDIMPVFPDTEGEGNKILLYKNHRGRMSRVFPNKIVLVDLKESRKTDIFSEYRSDNNRDRDVYATCSADGKCFALVKRPPKDRKEEGYITLVDSSGKFIGKHILPSSRGVEFWVNGWDYRSRLYFSQYSAEPSPLITCRRISPDNMIPEEIPDIPLDNYGIYTISPDGQKMALAKRPDADEEWKYGIYDIAKETYQPITVGAGRMSYFRWSPDNRMFAYTVPVDLPPGTDTGKAAWLSLSTLFLYDVETGVSRPAFDNALAHFSLHTWSPSGEYLLFSTRDIIERQSNTGEPFYVPDGPRKYHVVDIKSGRITAVSYPFEYKDHEGYLGRYLVRWISEDRLMWYDNKKLIATEYNGSNPQEIFRIENGKYYLYGEEQS